VLFLISEAIALCLSLDGFAVTTNNITANQAITEKLAGKLNQIWEECTLVAVIVDNASSLDVKAIVEAVFKQLGP
jgi:hypothetical protein